MIFKSKAYFEIGAVPRKYRRPDNRIVTYRTAQDSLHVGVAVSRLHIVEPLGEKRDKLLGKASYFMRGEAK